MPELYGHPYKWELRQRIRNLERDNSELCLETHKRAKRALRAEEQLELARAKIEALQAKIQRTEALAQQLLAELGKSVDDEAVEIFMRPFNKLVA